MNASAHSESLIELGWRQFFQSQLESDELESTVPVRIVGVERNLLRVAGLPGIDSLSLPRAFVAEGSLGVTVGDWVLVDAVRHAPVRVLDRFGVFHRKAAGTGREIQLIAANVDTLFILMSADEDFNIARLERYLTLAQDGGAHPVVVISKADLHGDVPSLRSQATRVAALVETVDTRDAESVSVLRHWCGLGQTVALVGSSGVGKSTLVNTLADAGQATRGVRQSDSKGRHTTTSRSMHRLFDGGWLLDTPGMRELQLFGVAGALDDVFPEIAELVQSCRFADCSHQAEPGCAVRAAIDDGRIDADRLKRFRKLQSESDRHTASLAERRARERSQGQLYKSIQRETQGRKRGD